MYGYRQKYHAEAGGLGQAACLKGRTQGDYPQGYAGAFYDRQSGQESAQSERCTQGGVTVL